VVLLFKRDFVALYKQTVLGPLWYVIQPVLTTVAFTLVFNKIAGISTEGTPPFLFYMAGVVIWNFFSNCLSKTSDTFVANAAIFGKVYFPRLVVPASVILSNLLTFAIQLLLLLSLLLYYRLRGAALAVTPESVLMLVLLPYIAAIGLSVGITVSALTTRFRDLTFLVGFAIQLWMYATPVVYPLSQIPEKWRWLYAFNPMAAPVETFRWLLFGTGTSDATLWLGSLATWCVLVFFGLMLFSRAERTSMDTV
jgi:lipopolysaccharide transport system permease protein